VIGQYHVLRGGSFLQAKDMARSTYRLKGADRYLDNYVGFRCALDIVQPTATPVDTPTITPHHLAGTARRKSQRSSRLQKADGQAPVDIKYNAKIHICFTMMEPRFSVTKQTVNING